MKTTNSKSKKGIIYPMVISLVLAIPFTLAAFLSKEIVLSKILMFFSIIFLIIFGSFLGELISFVRFKNKIAWNLPGEIEISTKGITRIRGKIVLFLKGTKIEGIFLQKHDSFEKLKGDSEDFNHENFEALLG